MSTACLAKNQIRAISAPKMWCRAFMFVVAGAGHHITPRHGWGSICHQPHCPGACSVSGPVEWPLALPVPPVPRRAARPAPSRTLPFIAPRGWAKLLPCIRKHHLEKDIQEHSRHVSSAAPTKICLSVNVTPQTYLKCPFLSPVFLCSFSLFFYTKCQLFSIWVIP